VIPLLLRALRRERLITIVILLSGSVIISLRGPVFCEYGRILKREPVTTASEEASHRDGLFAITGRSFLIYCDRDCDLKEIGDRLSKTSLFVNGVYGPNPAGSPAQKIAYRMDMILKRVKKTLDMYPDDMKLIVRIFAAEKDKKPVYSHKDRIIYVGQSAVSESAMACEMANAVIDCYFTVPPPEKVRQILASYVVMHLER
jgi:hypothetical protein